MLCSLAVCSRVTICPAATQPSTSRKRQHCCPPQAHGTGSFDAGDDIRQDDEFALEDFQSAALSLQSLEEYRLLMQQPEPDLLHGAVLIARHRHPRIQLSDINDILDDLAEQIKPILPSTQYPLKMVAAISDHLYENRGFRGNTEDYYDPDNSCINEVLRRRLGIPLTLSLVYMEVAKRCGFGMYGVNVPGHFLLTPADEEVEFFIDAFDGGKVAFLDDAAETLQKIYGRSVKLDPAFLRRKEQIPSRIFFTRMLNNLKAVYAQQKDYASALKIQGLLRATRPADLDEMKEEGFILYHVKRYSECAAVLGQWLQMTGKDDRDYAKVERLLEKLRNPGKLNDLEDNDDL